MSSVHLDRKFRFLLIYAALASIYLTFYESTDELKMTDEGKIWQSAFFRNISTTCQYAAVPLALMLLAEASKYKIMQNMNSLLGPDDQLISVFAIAIVISFSATYVPQSTTTLLCEQLLVMIFSLASYLKCFDIGPLASISQSLRKTAISTFLLNNLMDIFINILLIISIYFLSYLNTSFSTTAFLLAVSLSLANFQSPVLLGILFVGAILINPALVRSFTVIRGYDLMQRIGLLGRQLRVVIYPAERIVYQPISQVLSRISLVIKEKSLFLISSALSAASNQHAASATTSQAPAIQMIMTRRGKKSAAVVTPDAIDDCFVMVMIMIFITSSIIVIIAAVTKRMPKNNNNWSRLVLMSKHVLAAILMGLVFENESMGLLPMLALQPLIAEAILLSCQSLMSQSQNSNTFYNTTAIALDISNQEDQPLQVHQHAQHKNKRLFRRSLPLLGLQVFIVWRVLLLTISRIQSIVDART